MFSRVVEAEKEVCDQFDNCLPKGFGTVVPTISFAWSIFSVVLEGMDSLRMDNKLESLAFVITNFMARTIILILIQCFLNVYWILFFMLMVIGSNASVKNRFFSTLESSSCCFTRWRVLTSTGKSRRAY